MTAITAVPAFAAPVVPVTSLAATIDGTLPLASQPGWFYPSNAGVDFGVQGDALRLSNATTSGVITQLITPQLGASAGEPGSGGTYDEFDAHFTVASQTGHFQPGLKIEVAPDNGSGSRSGGSLSLYDNPATGKLEIGAIWSELGSSVEEDSGWYSKTLASVSPDVAHTVSLRHHFVTNGQDRLYVSVDGALVGVVGTYEQYAAESGGPLGTIDSLLFRAGTSVPSANGIGWDTQAAVPANAGHGFLVSDIGYKLTDWTGYSLADGTATTGPTVHTTADSFLQDWSVADTRATGHYAVTDDGLEVSTTTPTPGVTPSTDKSAGYFEFREPLALLGDPSWDLVNNSVGGQLPGKQIAVDLNGDGSFDGYLVGEDNFINPVGQAAGSGFWWLAEASAFAANSPATPRVSSGPAYRQIQGSLAQWRRAFPNAQTLAVGYSLGSGAIGDVTIQSMTFGDTTFTFGHDVCDAPTTQVVRSLDGLATDDAGAGSSVIEQGGLHVTTTTGSDKQSVFWPVASLPLRSVGEPSLGWTNAGSSTAEPGIQLRLDVDGNGTWDGTLVGESIYGNDWWLPGSGWYAQSLKDAAPSSSGGFGSDKHGTLAQWEENLEKAGVDARVIAVGYSLGTGPVGDGYITDLSYGCTDLTFAPKVTPVVSATVTKGAYGVAGTLAVTVAGTDSVVPTGTVTVTDGTFSTTATLASGAAQVVLPADLAAGDHTFTVSYSGDQAVTAATQQVTATVAKAAATVSADDASLVYGVAGSLDVAVTNEVGVTATGSVTVTEGTFSATETLRSGAATIALPAGLAAGSHTFALSYSGDDKLAAAPGSVQAVVSKASAAVSAVITKGGYGTAGTIAVKVGARTSSGATIAGVTPTGTVTVSEGSFSVRGSLSNGAVALALPAALEVGDHRFTVSYAGDTHVGAASTQASVGVALTASYLLSADVQAAAGTKAALPVLVIPGDVTGTVTVRAGSTTVGSAKVTGGAAKVSLASNLAVGAHALTVAYSGDKHTAASTTTVTLYVVKAAPKVSVSAASTHYGTAAKVTVKVSATGKVDGGTVTVKQGTKKLASAKVSHGVATLTLSKTLSVGTHRLTVAYAGTSSVNASSATKTVKVAKASAKASLKVSASHVKPNKKGKATVKVTSAKGVKVAGKATVTFTNRSTHSKATVTVKVKNGKASVKFPSLVSGTYSVSVKFAGSSTVGAATSKAAKFSVHW